ncbi:hypothetical protein AAW14_02535 [Streptomyces hygroscopicus]|nr:hypothetical protein [Streptomyces hygroscopicus]
MQGGVWCIEKPMHQAPFVLRQAASIARWIGDLALSKLPVPRRPILITSPEKPSFSVRPPRNGGLQASWDDTRSRVNRRPTAHATVAGRHILLAMLPLCWCSTQSTRLS